MHILTVSKQSVIGMTLLLGCYYLTHWSNHGLYKLYTRLEAIVAQPITSRVLTAKNKASLVLSINRFLSFP